MSQQKRHKNPGAAFHRKQGRSLFKAEARAASGTFSPWFLKAYGARPVEKRQSALREVA